MAHFRGTLSGCRGMASRLGSKHSGLSVTAASWQGAVDVQLYEKDGRDYASISLTPHQGQGLHRKLFDDPVDGKPRPRKTKE